LGPLNIFAVNHEEFKSSILQIMTYFVPAALIFILILYVAISKVFSRHIEAAVAVLLAVSSLLYIEGHFLINQYKRFDGAVGERVVVDCLDLGFRLV
jgi:hypothetical protein